MPDRADFHRPVADPRVAAVVFGADDEVDAALAAAVATLGREGVRVAGLLQELGAAAGPCRREMHLLVLATGGRLRLDDPRGPEVQGCTLDADALARAAMELREAVRARPDLLVVSRFGKQEAQGGGMRAEIAEALLSGIPVVVAVRDSLLADWEAFLGAPAAVLPPTEAAVAAWSRAAAAVER
jgi:molybdate transport system ATP-binding protein